MSGFDGVLRRYGRPVAVHRNGACLSGLAMVQPLFESHEQWLPSPLGRTRQDRFLCLAAPEPRLDGLSEEDFLEWEGVRYNVITTQSVSLGNQTLYQWAVLSVRDNA